MQNNQERWLELEEDPKNNNGSEAQWKQLCEAALLELDPTKLLERIAAARSAILDQIEDRFSTRSRNGQSSDGGEQLALRNALATLTVLRTIAERQISEQRKTGT